MSPISSDLTDLEQKLRSSQALNRADMDRLWGCPDLISIGSLGELARQAKHGNRITYGRVCEFGPGGAPERGEAGEVRIVGAVESAEHARTQVREAAKLAAGVPLTGFSLAGLLMLVGGDHLALVDLALMLK